MVCLRVMSLSAGFLIRCGFLAGNPLRAPSGGCLVLSGGRIPIPERGSFGHLPRRMWSERVPTSGSDFPTFRRIFFRGMCQFPGWMWGCGCAVRSGTGRKKGGGLKPPPLDWMRHRPENLRSRSVADVGCFRSGDQRSSLRSSSRVSGCRFSARQTYQM